MTRDFISGTVVASEDLADPSSLNPVRRICIRKLDRHDHKEYRIMITVTRAYKYACREPLNWGPDCEGQLKLSTKFWNTLVEIEHKFSAARRVIINHPPELTSLNEEIKELQDQIEALFEEKKKLNKAARKNAITPDLDRKIKALKSQLRPLFASAKVLRKQSVVDNKPLLDEQDALRFNEIKSARQQIAAEGLWWGNYNTVLESFNTAVAKSYKDNAILHTKYFNGEGRLTNQIQGGVSVETVLLGENTRVKFINEPWEYEGKGQVKPQPKQRYHLDFCAYADGRNKRMVRLPIVYHRELPEGATIKMVALKRTKQYDRWKWFVVFTLIMEVDETTIPRGNGVAVVNFGWRKTDDGVRIATILRNGRIDYVIYPDRIWSCQLAGERNRGTMDDATNKMVGWLKQLPLEQAPENIQNLVATMRGFRRIRGGHFEWLRKTWEVDARLWQPELLKELQNFGYDWRLYSRNDAAGRVWARNAREAYYQMEVRRLFEGVGTIVLNGHDMSETANTKKSKSSLPREVRHQRCITAPSVFRMVLMKYAKKYLIDTIVDDGKHDVCACHGEPFVDHDRRDLFWSCPVHGGELDQDDNFVRLMLRRYEAREEKELVDS